MMENADSKSGSSRSKRFKATENTLLVLMLVLGAYTIDPHIFTVGVMADIFRGVALISVFGIAQCIVLASGGMDLSIARNGLLSASIIYYFLERSNLNVILVVVIALTVSSLFGLINGIFVSRLKVEPVIVTMGTALLTAGFSGSISNNIILFDTAEQLSFLKMSLYSMPISLFMAIVVMVTCWAVFKYTVIGRQVFAVGGSQRSAKLSGLNVDLIKILSYTCSGFLAGIGGLMVLANSTVAARFYAAGPEITIFFALIIGGISMYDGERIFFNASIGACVLALLNRLIYGIYAYNYMRSIIIGILVLLTLAVRKNIFKGKE